MVFDFLYLTYFTLHNIFKVQRMIFLTLNQDLDFVCLAAATHTVDMR